MRRICARVDKRKTARPFFAFRLTRTNPSSAEDLRASLIKEKRAKRFSTPDFINQIRAVRNLQRARSAKFPAQELCASPKKNGSAVFRLSTSSPNSEQCAGLCASPITRSNASVTPCVLIRNCSRLSYLLLHLKGYESLRTDKRKTARPFFAARLTGANPNRGNYWAKNRIALYWVSQN